jgi:hypothetical protein
MLDLPQRRSERRRIAWWALAHFFNDQRARGRRRARNQCRVLTLVDKKTFRFGGKKHAVLALAFPARITPKSVTEPTKSQLG